MEFYFYYIIWFFYYFVLFNYLSFKVFNVIWVKHKLYIYIVIIPQTSVIPKLDIVPNLVIAIIMGGVVYLINLIKLPDIVVLIIQILVGISSYLFLSYISAIFLVVSFIKSSSIFLNAL